MDWRKRHRLYNIILSASIVLMMVAVCPTFCLSQDTTSTSNTWNNEQWEEAKKGLNYDEKTKEKKKKEEANEVEEIEEKSSWNIAEFFNRIFTSQLGKIISIVLIIGLLVYTVIKILVVKGNDSGKKIASINSIEDFEEIEDNLPESDLEKFLRLALEKRDFKLAVRILFLTTIQKLNEAEIIHWKKDKTNQDYLYEMRKSSDYEQFRYLTFTYEIIWYGDTPIDEKIYARLNPSFKNYNDKLSVGDKKQ